MPKKNCYYIRLFAQHLSIFSNTIIREFSFYQIHVLSIWQLKERNVYVSTEIRFHMHVARLFMRLFAGVHLIQDFYLKIKEPVSKRFKYEIYNWYIWNKHTRCTILLFNTFPQVFMMYYNIWCLKVSYWERIFYKQTLYCLSVKF